MKLKNSFTFSDNRDIDKDSPIYKFLDTWKQLYDESKKSETVGYRETFNPIENTNDLQSFEIIHNDDSTTDIIFNYKSGHKITLKNVELFDMDCLQHDEHSNHNHKEMDPTQLTFTFTYDTFL